MPGLSFNFFDSPSTLMVPGIIALAFTLLFIPSLMVPGARAEHVGRAIACVIMKVIGLLLIAVSAVQLGYSLVTLQLLNQATLSSLVLLLVVGIGLMIYGSMLIHEIDDESSVIPRLVFTHTCEAIGLLVVLVSGLSIAVSFLSTQRVQGWEMQVTLVLLGLVLLLSSSIHIREKNKRSMKGGRRRR